MFSTFLKISSGFCVVCCLTGCICGFWVSGILDVVDWDSVLRVFIQIQSSV